MCVWWPFPVGLNVILTDGSDSHQMNSKYVSKLLLLSDLFSGSFCNHPSTCICLHAHFMASVRKTKQLDRVVPWVNGRAGHSPRSSVEAGEWAVALFPCFPLLIYILSHCEVRGKSASFSNCDLLEFRRWYNWKHRAQQKHLIQSVIEWIIEGPRFPLLISSVLKAEVHDYCQPLDKFYIIPKTLPGSKGCNHTYAIYSGEYSSSFPVHASK